MKVIKILLGIIVAVLAILFVGSFFISSNWRVSQAQVIKASPEAVYNELITPGEWKNWSYWALLDSNSKMTCNDTKSGVGAAYSWKSEKKEIGSGTLTISSAVPNTYVKVDLFFDGNGGGFGEYVLKPVDGGTEVTSSFNSETKSFIEKWMSRLMGKPMMKKAFKSTMENMEKYIADHPAPQTPPAPPIIDTTGGKGVK